MFNVFFHTLIFQRILNVYFPYFKRIFSVFFPYFHTYFQRLPSPKEEQETTPLERFPSPFQFSKSLYYDVTKFHGRVNMATTHAETLFYKIHF